MVSPSGVDSVPVTQQDNIDFKICRSKFTSWFAAAPAWVPVSLREGEPEHTHRWTQTAVRRMLGQSKEGAWAVSASL